MYAGRRNTHKVCQRLIRGKEHSALFEKMVNEAWRIRPGIKILFSSGPYDIINCINRNDL